MQNNVTGSVTDGTIAGDGTLDTIVLSVGISVGGLLLLTILVSLLLLLALRRLQMRGQEKVGGVNTHGTWTGKTGVVQIQGHFYRSKFVSYCSIVGE